MEEAHARGADKLATGHYASIAFNTETHRYLLKRGKERGKDQSYFLARLSQESLSQTLFPVGQFTKTKIRQLAARFGLPVADKAESQEVCFIPDGNIIRFIKSRISTTSEGPILDRSGQIIGKHQGIIGYTIGQRKGLGIALGKPVYVTRIDARSNTLVIGNDDDLYHQKFIAKDPHWIALSELTQSQRFHVRIRYKHRPSMAIVEPKGEGSIQVSFDRHQRAITPGQLAVFYDGDSVAGSAWIDEIIN
jgi:tRNA-specific 2-thiouridylase